jgi:hypothetical protein
MKSSAGSGVLAGIVAALALAAPALAAPADVTVRVEGTAATLVPETPLRTADAPVVRDGRSCSGTSALGALHAATRGDWSGTWFDGLGWSVEVIKGEQHVFPDYYGLWINSAYSELGLCGAELQTGDDVLVVPAAEGPILDLTGVPPRVTAGQAVTVTVTEHGAKYREEPPFDLIRTDGPAVGATVSLGGATATVGADGRARLVFGSAGATTVQATQPGHIRSAVRTVEVAAPAPGDPPPPRPEQDTTAPTAAFSSALADGTVFPRREAPRELSGTVSADPSGLRSVRLSILRKRGGRCWTYRDTTERFKRHRCGGKWYFRIGDRAEWSYLLPRKLPRGRYTIGVMAVDKAFNESRATVRIRVK